MYSFPTNCHKNLKGTDLWNFRGETFCLNCSDFYWRMFRFDDANLNPVNEFRAWSREHFAPSFNTAWATGTQHWALSTLLLSIYSTEPGQWAVCTDLDQWAFSTEHWVKQMELRALRNCLRTRQCTLAQTGLPVSTAEHQTLSTGPEHEAVNPS
jgi:hypothetical protein